MLRLSTAWMRSILISKFILTAGVYILQMVPTFSRDALFSGATFSPAAASNLVVHHGNMMLMFMRFKFFRELFVSWVNLPL